MDVFQTDIANQLAQFRRKSPQPFVYPRHASEYNFYVYSGGFVKSERPPPRAVRRRGGIGREE